MKRLIFTIIIIVLMGCAQTIPPEVVEEPVATPPPLPEFITFESVSQPYRDQRGEPEEINKYDSDDYHTVDWWYWTQGFEVSFIDSPYDDIYGWRVDSTYTFEPIP